MVDHELSFIYPERRLPKKIEGNVFFITKTLPGGSKHTYRYVAVEEYPNFVLCKADNGCFECFSRWELARAH